MSLDIDALTKQVELLHHNKYVSLSLAIEKITHLYHELIEIEVAMKDLVRVEKLKTRLIELFYLKLNIESEKKQLSEKIIPWHEKIYRHWFSCVGTFLAGVAGYTATSSLISAFTNFSNPLSLACSIIVGIIEAIVFVGIDVLDVKKTGMLSPQFKLHMAEYEIQLDNTKLIQKVLLTTRAFRKLTSNEFLLSKSFILKVQNDIKQKNDEIAILCKDSLIKKVIKIMFITLGAVLSTGSGIIAGKSLLAVFGAAALTTTPVGWVVGVSVGVLSLATFVYNQRNSIMNMFDKFIGFPKALKKSQDKFIASNAKYHRYLDEIIADKKNDELKEKAVNDRIMALEREVGELKLLINTRTELPKIARAESTIKPLQINNQNKGFKEMIYSNALRLKNSLFSQSDKDVNSKNFISKSPSLMRQEVN